MADDDEVYTNIRAVTALRDLIGQAVVDITGNDPDDEDGIYVEFFFADGTALRFPIDPARGFVIRGR